MTLRKNLSQVRIRLSKYCTARILKLLRGPGIDSSLEPIPPAYLAL
jgi:hypothetical protein